VTGEHAKVVDLPPRCGPRRPHITRTRTVTTESVQLQQPSLSTKHFTQTFTPTTPQSASPTCTGTSRCDEHSVNICDGCQLWSAESSCLCPAARKYETDPCIDMPVSRSSRHDSALSLDNVSLWEESRDFTARGALPTTTASQSSAVDPTTADDDSNERYSEDHAIERPLSAGRDEQHPALYTASQRTGTPTTSTVDLWQGRDWRCPSPTQDVSAAAAAAAEACVDPGFIPSIIESSGRPATANRSAADLANGSVELRQRRTGAGLDLYVRGMQLRFINSNGDHSTTTTEVKVADGKVTRLNDVTSSQPSHSSVNKLHLTSRGSCPALRFY